MSSASCNTNSLLLVADGKVRPFDGDLEDYRQWVKEQNQRRDAVPPLKGTQTGKTTGSNGTTGEATKKQNRQDAADKRKQLQPQRKKVKKLEQKMEKLGKEKAQLEEQLADNSLYSEENKNKLKPLLAQQTAVTQQLQDVEEQWLEASEVLEGLMN